MKKSIIGILIISLLLNIVCIIDYFKQKTELIENSFYSLSNVVLILESFEGESNHNEDYALSMLEKECVKLDMIMNEMCNCCFLYKYSKPFDFSFFELEVEKAINEERGDILKSFHKTMKDLKDKMFYSNGKVKNYYSTKGILKEYEIADQYIEKYLYESDDGL